MAAPTVAPAPRFKALADPLVEHKAVLEHLLELLKDPKYGEACKSLNSVAASVDTTRKLLLTLSDKSSGALTLSVLHFCQTHLDQVALLLREVEPSALPAEATKKFNAFVRNNNTWSDQVARTTAEIAQAPVMMEGVTAALYGIGQVKVTWNAPIDPYITEYVVTAIVMKPDGTTPTKTTVEHWVGRGMKANGSISAIIGELQQGSTYTFTVRAVNDYGEGPVCEPPSNPVTMPNVPGKPTKVQATPGIGQATVTWIAPADGGAPITESIVTATLMDNAGKPTTITTEQWVSGGSTSAVVRDLSDGASYTFTVRAVNTVGEGPDADPATTSVLDVPGPPKITALNPDTDQVTVVWNPPTPQDPSITGYIVAVSGPGTLDTVPVDGATTSWLIDGLDNAGTYSFTVAATNDVGTGQASAPATITLPVSQPALDCSSMQNIDDLLKASAALLVSVKSKLLTDWLGDFASHLTCAQQLLDTNDSGIDPATDQKTVSALTANWQQAVLVFQARATVELGKSPDNTATYAMAALLFETLLSAAHSQLEKIMTQNDLIGSRS